MENTSQFFKDNRYVVIKSAISKELRNFVTQYALFDEMQKFIPGDSQVNNAHSKYADPAMETILVLLQDTMERSTGLSLFPTYSYYRVYRNGDILENHVDREACEISATVCFNYSYNDKDYKWPIYLDNIEVFQNPGDLVIYRGCEVPHWRNSFNHKSEAWQVQGFFHYVDANGPNYNEKWDRRESLGIVKEDANHGFDRAKKRESLTINVPSYITYTK